MNIPQPKNTPSINTDLTQLPHEAESKLRPLLFSDFGGQPKTIRRLKVMVGAAKARGDALSHILFHGPPGLGKTTLAYILGNEMGKKVSITSGPVIEKAGDLAGLLTNLEAGDILFIDEIHRLSKNIEEYLYSAMEDFRIDIMIDQGPNAKNIRLSIPPFTLVGATTRTGLLSAPLRSRFTLQTRLDYYSNTDLTKIIHRTADILKIEIDSNAAEEIAKRARGTPRIANNHMAFVRDYAQQAETNRISQALASDALELLEIDACGLDEMDKRILRTIAENYKGGPVGLGTVAVAVGEETHTLEEVYEPYLIQEGYLQRTPQGRILTLKSWNYLGLSRPTSQLNLFEIPLHSKTQEDTALIH